MVSKTFLGLSFTSIEIEHRAILEPFLKKNPQRLSDYTFASLYAWRDVYKHAWAWLDPDTLLLSLEQEGNMHLYRPLGVFSEESQATLLREAANLDYSLKLFGVDNKFFELYADFTPHFDSLMIPEGANYLYRATDLATLSGRRYSKKRNLIAQAESELQWSVGRLAPDHGTECCRILQEIGPHEGGQSLEDESRALKAMCSHLSELGPEGVIIYANDVPVAFSVFDELNPETAVVYFEKAEREYKGLYQLVNRETAKIILHKGYQFINREADLGHEGLRQAKLSYHPVELVEYFNLKSARASARRLE